MRLSSESCSGYENPSEATPCRFESGPGHQSGSIYLRHWSHEDSPPMRAVSSGVTVTKLRIVRVERLKFPWDRRICRYGDVLHMDADVAETFRLLGFVRILA